MRNAGSSPEALESRIAPATIVVNSQLDDGDGNTTTLREAILKATNPGADTIVFAATLTCTSVLGGAAIPITDTLTIKGPGIHKLTVSGGSFLGNVASVGGGLAQDGGTAPLSGSTVTGNWAPTAAHIFLVP